MRALNLLMAIGLAIGGSNVVLADDDSQNGKTELKGVPLERLIELNSEALFGGKVKVEGDSFEVTFDKDGQMRAGFDGRKIVDSKHSSMTGAQRNFIIQKKEKDVETLIPGLAALGMGQDMWVSKFPVAGNAHVRFGFRIPNLMNQQSTFRARLNWNKTSGYETNFFQNLAYISGGMVKSNRMTMHPEYQRAPSYWFPRKEKKSVEVDFSMQDGTCTLTMNGEEMVSIPDLKDKGGHIAFAFRKCLFTIDNLKIGGLLDSKWCEKELKKLDKRGKLKTEEETLEETPAVDS